MLAHTACAYRWATRWTSQRHLGTSVVYPDGCQERGASPMTQLNYGAPSLTHDEPTILPSMASSVVRPPTTWTGQRPAPSQALDVDDHVKQTCSRLTSREPWTPVRCSDEDDADSC